MLTAKELIDILQQYEEDTPVLLYDSNIEGFEYVAGEDGIVQTTKPNLPHNSFENILECHVNKVVNNGIELLIKRAMINPKTNEVVGILVHPDSNTDPEYPAVKAILISPDPIIIYEPK